VQPPIRSKFSASPALGLAFLAALASFLACDRRLPEAAEAAAAQPAEVATAEPVPPEPVRYGRDIRPILSDRCFVCHGPDPGKRKANLRLDIAAGATELRDGIAAIVPGDTQRSELLRRVNCRDEEERMPPQGSNKREISADEALLLERWIAEGAEYEPHWAFVAPQRPPLPATANAAWGKNPIDAFVLAKLEAHGVAPGVSAPAPSLLRRLFLDLTGLPPTTEELDQFLADPSPAAFESWVQKLLHEEPYVSRFAEHMATPWLDASRYADTSGIHMDAGRSIWPWRDWVLAAYRDGMPFDRFVTEQIAGDLLADATEAQKVASGFNRNHVTTDEGGAIAEEYLVEYAVDRAATTGSVFLGLTMGCARCHDHKFDPVSQDEFYRFYAYFNSIEEPGLYTQEPDPKRAFEPFMEVRSPKDRERIDALDAQLVQAKAALDAPDPDEDRLRARFQADLLRDAGVRWASAPAIEASSERGASLKIQEDGSVLASGENPPQDVYTITLRTEARELRLVALEALTDPDHVNSRVGRAYNGNAVMSGIEGEAISIADPTQRKPLRWSWAWADFEQANGDFRVVNTLDAEAGTGWAVDGHNREGGRAALFLADEPFGFEGGTRLEFKLRFESQYDNHVFGRVRLALGTLDSTEMLPSAASSWSLAGPFAAARSTSYETAFGPEEPGALDAKRRFGEKKVRWTVRPEFKDGELYKDLPADETVTYLGRRLRVPSKRKLEVALSSDDGFRLFVDGVEAAGQKVDRGLERDQNRATLELEAGTHEIVLKIVNTGGIGGFMWRVLPREGELGGDMPLALLPEPTTRAIDPEGLRFARAWRFSFSPEYRERATRVETLGKELAAAKAAVPRTMVMKELEKQRETYVLMRGQYDQPDKSRRVERGVPAALGELPEGAPPDRRGLASWLVSKDNPLVARVAVNRMWEQLFGSGIVRSSEDFGLQGEWPSHPELLDWLAVEFQDSGWDVKHMLALMLNSATYRQSSSVRAELAERDPDNRWLSYFPRQRLSAEQIRDTALFTSGLLIEQLGGPSVKPYQPEGLWQEVAMLQSNTRIFERGMDADMWRRSLYTYWKRACPPPSLLTFDAPTREFCTIRRATTNTPLQALVLWNDEQYVEAARVLAQRLLSLDANDDAARLGELLRRCTGRAPDAEQQRELQQALIAFRARYAGAAEEAKALVETGLSPVDERFDAVELAAWTMLCSAVLNLDATITKS